MLKAFSPAVALLAALALAGPAAAVPNDTTPAPVCSGTGENDPGTCTSAGDQSAVGDGHVVTDPADEIDGTADSNPPKQGELHVLGTAARASSPAPAARPAAPALPAAARPTAQTAVANSPNTLPFTGVDARPLALMGLALLLSGWLLRRRLDASA